MSRKGNFFEDSLDRKEVPIVSTGVVVKGGANDTQSEGEGWDKFNAGIIKVRLYVDGQLTDDELIECAPLLPRFFNVLPKENEAVFIFTKSYRSISKKGELNTQRYWVGPVITQDINLREQDFLHATSLLSDGAFKLEPPGSEPGAYGNAQGGDVTLQGRHNTDIIQKTREIWIRSGKFEEDDNRIFNQRDLGYIQLKYGKSTLQQQLVPREITTYQYENPTILINTQIKVYPPGSDVPLAGNLPFAILDLANHVSENYTTNVTIVVNKNDDKKTQLFTFDSKLTGDYDTLDEGINKSIELVDIWKGEKWKIKSNSNIILEHYGNDPNNKVIDYAVFEANPTEITKTVHETKTVINKDNKSSVLNMVANKINLISHDGEHTFILADPKSLISDKEQVRINSESHPLVYGDTLVEFLNLVKVYVRTHSHEYHQQPADDDTDKSDVLKFNLDTLLNHNITSN